MALVFRRLFWKQKIGESNLLIMLSSSRHLIQSLRHLKTTQALSSGIISKLKGIVGSGDEEVNEAERDEEPEIAKIEFPLQNVQERLTEVVTDAIGKPQALNEVDLKDSYLKYKILMRCQKEFGLLPESYVISNCGNADDLLNYYSSLQPKPITPFHRLEKEVLPLNLVVEGHPQSPT